MLQRYTWLSIAAFGLISSQTFADEAKSIPTEKSSVTADMSLVSNAPGVQVFIDEQTGQVRSPTQAETAAMAEHFKQHYIDAAVDKPVVYHSDGSISQELGAHKRLYSVARLSDDGELETQCLPVEQVAEFLTSDDETDVAVELAGDKDE